MELQPEFGIQLRIPILMGINLGECGAISFEILREGQMKKKNYRKESLKRKGLGVEKKYRSEMHKWKLAKFFILLP